MELRLFRPEDSGTDRSLRSIIDAYLQRSRDRLAARTYAERNRILTAFRDRFGHLPISECRPSDLEDWIAGNPDWSSDWTRAGVVKTVKACLNWAVRDRRIADNPFRYVTHPEGSPRRPMTDEEFRRLMRSTTPLFRRLLLFMRLTGARPCEASALTWEMLDRSAGAFVLHEHKTSRTQKHRRPRVIYLVPVAARLIAWLERDGSRRRHVFVNTRGGAWNRSSLSLRMQRLRVAAGVPPDCYLYGTRHAFGTRGARAGVALKVLAELMGHASAATTEKYYVHLGTQSDFLREQASRVTRGPID